MFINYLIPGKSKPVPKDFSIDIYKNLPRAGEISPFVANGFTLAPQREAGINCPAACR